MSVNSIWISLTEVDHDNGSSRPGYHERASVVHGVGTGLGRLNRVVHRRAGARAAAGHGARPGPPRAVSPERSGPAAVRPASRPPGHGVYEAGRDGCWWHRFLRAPGVQNVVVDASSIGVNRPYRRSKTDGLDVQKLLTMLVRFVLGETGRWQVVRVPSAEDEALRQPHREVSALQEARTQHIDRMQGMLAGLGLEVVIDHTFPERLLALRQ